MKRGAACETLTFCQSSSSLTSSAAAAATEAAIAEQRRAHFGNLFDLNGHLLETLSKLSLPTSMISSMPLFIARTATILFGCPICKSPRCLCVSLAQLQRRAGACARTKRGNAKRGPPFHCSLSTLMAGRAWWQSRPVDAVQLRTKIKPIQ